MTRIKLLAISTITAVMILGSTLVFASSPASDNGTDTSAGSAAITTDVSAPDLAAANPGPKRSGGGTGRSLKK